MHSPCGKSLVKTHNVCKWQNKELQGIHKWISRRRTLNDMSYVLKWFCSWCSSAQMGLLPCPIWQILNKITKAAETCTDTFWCSSLINWILCRSECELQKPTEMLREVQVTLITLTSPASCWKTRRNCFSSSFSFCSAYTAGLRGGGCGWGGYRYHYNQSKQNSDVYIELVM